MVSWVPLPLLALQDLASFNLKFSHILSLNPTESILETTITWKQDLFTNYYKITINWGTIQVLGNVFYTKVSHIRWLTHRNGHIIPAFIIYHIHALHLHKSLHYHTPSFSKPLFCQLHISYFHRFHAWSWHKVVHVLHFPKKKTNYKNKNKKRTKRKSQWSLNVHTTFLVTCVGYHVGIIHPFLKKMIENNVNVVPNAWLTRK